MATKVNIQIGPFVNAPARILTAVRDKEESELHTVCVGKPQEGEDPGPYPTHPAAKVNQYFRCTHCEREERSFHPYPRGRENPDGTWTIPPSLADLEATEDMKTSLAFLPALRSDVEAHGVPFGKFYYVGPNGQPAMYALARDIIRETRDEWVWLTQWAYRTAPSFVRAVVMEDLLAIQQLALPEQIVDRPLLNLPASNPQHLAMMLTSVPLLAVQYNANTFPDVRKQKLAEILGKADTVAGAAPAVSTPVQEGDDALLVSMQQWLDQHGASVGGSSKTPTRGQRAVAAALVDGGPETDALLDAVAPKRTRKAPTKSATPAAPRKRTSRKSTTTKESA